MTPPGAQRWRDRRHRFRYSGAVMRAARFFFASATGLVRLAARGG